LEFIVASKKKILVTGGVGFIGSHTVVELIDAGYEPILLDNLSNSKIGVLKSLEKIIKRTVKFYENDCNDISALRNIFRIEKNIVGVIHFAANKAVGESVIDPLKYYQNNIGSLVSILSVMQEYNILNLVFSSSCTVYGQPTHLPVNEDSPVLKAQSPYGNSKQICEEIIHDVYYSGKPIKAISLRYFNPIGAHHSALIGELPLGMPNNLIPFVTQTAAGIREELTVFGNDYNTPDGTCVRDYIHVVDLAKAHVKALDKLFTVKEDLFHDVINVGTGKGESVLNVIHAFEKIAGLKLNYKIGPRRAGDIQEIYADVQKSASVLSWKAEKNMEEAILDAWNWQQNLKNLNLV
jgi:UDP-glucose 4-epimerase